jgi:hypothetical protein
MTSKSTLDYSNTVIYKIYCKDESITDVYVGHTTNFNKRKMQHESVCNNLKNQSKIYDVIRSNGGWQNWNMIEIATYCCQDKTEARIKENEHCISENATLNTCPPYADRSSYFCLICDVQCNNKIDYDKHINRQIHLDKLGRIPEEMTGKNNYCKCCNYASNKASNFERHLQSVRHKNTENNSTLGIPNVKIYECKPCNKVFKVSSGLWRHNHRHHSQSVSNTIETLDQSAKDDLIIQLLKQNNELIERQQLLIERIVKNQT